MDFRNAVTCDHKLGVPTTGYTLTSCPRCLGRGYYGGVVIDERGQLNLVAGSTLLAQQLQKILSENARESGYGFNYDLLTGVIDPARLSAIRSELVRCISYLRFVQQQEKSQGFIYQPSEELSGIKEVSVANSPTDPRAITVACTVVSVSGTQTSTTVIMRR